MFERDQIYNRRRDLHERYGGQRQGGISTPTAHPFIMLFTSAIGTQYGYKDGWMPDGRFRYTGEGQQSDMTFTRGNQAIRDHEEEGKTLEVFEYVASGQVRYIGRMVYEGHEFQQGLDAHGNQRQVIVFILRPLV